MLLISTWKGSPEHHHPAQEVPMAEGAAYEPSSVAPGGRRVGIGQREPETNVRDTKQALSLLKSENDAATAFGPSHGGLVIPLSGEKEEMAKAPLAFAPAADPTKSWAPTKLQYMQVESAPAEVPKRERASRPVLDLNLPPPLSEEEEQDFLRDAARVEQQALFSAGQAGEMQVEVGEEPGALSLPQADAKPRTLGGLVREPHPQGVPLGIAPSRATPRLDLTMEEHGLRSHAWSTEAVLIRHGHEEENLKLVPAPQEFPRFVELRYSMEHKGGSDVVGPSRESEPSGMLKRGLVDPPKEMEGNGHPSGNGLTLRGEYGPGNMLAKRTRLG